MIYSFKLYHWRLSSLHIYPFVRRVENQHFKAKFTLLKFKSEPEPDEDRKIALVFEGNRHRIRTFRSPEDMEERIVNFYDNMDSLFTKVDKKHADYRKLVEAVQRVMELINQAVASPASSDDQESIFNREVSPDLDVNAGIGHQEQDKISPSVRDILSDFGNGNTAAEEEEDDGIQIESSTAANATPRDNNVNVGGEVVVNKARISLSPDHAKDPSPQDADERKLVSAYGTGSPLSFTIDPNLEWKKVFSLLRQNGWKWLNGKIIHDKVLVKPGCNYKGGKVGEDFFPTDTMGHGDEIKEYMKENYGWVGPTLESSSSEESDAQVEANGESDDCEFGDDADSEDDQMVDDATNSGGQGEISEQMDVPMIVETKRSDDVFEFKDDDENADVIDYGYMPWMLVWQSMHSHGWRVARGPGDELYYLRPGVESTQGEYGEAFVYEEDVKNIAKEEFGWKGEKPPRASAKRNAVVSAEKPSKKHKSQKKVIPSSEKSNRSKKHTSSVKTSQKKSSWAAKKKRTDDDKGRTWGKARKTAATSPERVTWKSLKTEGWTAKRAGGKNKLHDWYYIRPGFSLSNGAKLNEHYFENENAAIKYATDHLNQSKKSPFTSSEASEPSAQVPSSQPASPLATDCVMEESSSLNTDDSSTKKSHCKKQDSSNDGQDSVYSHQLEDLSFVPKMKPTWKSLQKYEGWTVISARRYNTLHDWYYIRPGCSPFGTEGVHYFQNKFDAVTYAETHQEECLKNHPIPSDCESSEHSHSSISSVSSANLSPSDANESPVNVPSSQPESPVISERNDSSSEEGSYEPFALDGDHESWWLNEEMPKFMKHIWKLLRKIGVKHRGDEYVTADGRVLGSVEKMQVYFCQEGLFPAAFSTLDHKEIQVLSRFASLAHMPRKVGKYHLNPENSIAIFTNLPGGSSFNDTDAWDVLCEHFGARILENEVFVDCIGDKVTTYTSVQDIRRAIRVYGIKRTCGIDVDLDEYHVALLLWASVLPLPVQKSAETELPQNESQTNKVELATLQMEETEERTEGETLVCATDSIRPESKEIEVQKSLGATSEHALHEIQDAEMLKDNTCANTTKSTRLGAEVDDKSNSETQNNAPELPIPEPEAESSKDETELPQNGSQTNKVELATLQTEETEERTEGETLMFATDSITPESKEIEVPKSLDAAYQEAEMLKDNTCASANTTKSTRLGAEVDDKSNSETQNNAPELPIPEPEAESSKDEVGIIDSAVPSEAKNTLIDSSEESEEELTESNVIVPETQDDGGDKEEDDAQGVILEYNNGNEKGFTEAISSKNIDSKRQTVHNPFWAHIPDPSSMNPTTVATSLEGNIDGLKSNPLDLQFEANSDRDGDDDEPEEVYAYYCTQVGLDELSNIDFDDFSPNANNADKFSNAPNSSHDDNATNLDARKNLFDDLNLN